ncbi:MAG: carboxypeptidase-like regulatory domain-containing protein [Oscillospiraceae bacterium]|jgi:hypothetical protein|nr:carboxypeptidase-like regulatory domain-containing protein [Oscillospiraceae bacterium]
MPCKPTGLCRCRKANFSLRIVDITTREGIAAAVLVVQSNGCPLFSVRSDADGFLTFPPLCPGTYTLALTVAQGYTLASAWPALQVTAQGNLRLKGHTVKKITLLLSEDRK